MPTKRTIFCDSCLVTPSPTMKSCPACVKLYQSIGSKRHYLDNKEDYLLRTAKRKKERPKDNCAYNKKWRDKNKKHCKERHDKWRKKNPDKISMQGFRRRWGEYAEARIYCNELVRLLKTQGAM